MENINNLNAIDLFSGCGGLSEGLRQAGFNVIAGVEVEKNAVKAYKLNHQETVLFEDDIRKIDTENIKKLLADKPLHLLAGCPPCQGFSSIRKLNRKQAIYDERNNLINEYYRFIDELNPLTIMLENVPGIVDYDLFKSIVAKLKDKGYYINYAVVNIAKYSVPQRRKRLVLVGSKLGEIPIASGSDNIVTVKQALAKINNIVDDELHKIYPKHTEKVQEKISKIPKDGGSRSALPSELQLKCHLGDNRGFNDIYGRLKWDDVSSTITGGCLNPSKGRFLHPEEDRCISAREAALLQTFPPQYKFPLDITKGALALLIGNALPPEFSRQQADNIKKHIIKYNA